MSQWRRQGTGTYHWLIVTLLTAALLLPACSYVLRPIGRAADIGGQLNSLRVAVAEEDWVKADAVYSEVLASWEGTRRRLLPQTTHASRGNFEESLTRLDVAIALEDPARALEEVSVLQGLWRPFSTVLR